jgi:hypothetical protein
MGMGLRQATTTPSSPISVILSGVERFLGESLHEVEGPRAPYIPQLQLKGVLPGQSRATNSNHYFFSSEKLPREKLGFRIQTDMEEQTVKAKLAMG